MNIQLMKGDCLKELKKLKDNSVDSVVTDPPYEIGFMGKGWDDSGIANNPKLWKEILRVLKPGGHLLSFSHSRTYHRQAVAVEDAGFEIRDQIMWVYGSGFPKSHNIGHKVDEYQGWGTALKPAHEPIVMARKPFKGSVAQNVLEYGTGGINIDGCRVGTEKVSTHSNGKGNTGDKGIYGTYANQQGSEEREGRFPANFIHDGIEEEWARFFYCPKAQKKDRNEGMPEEVPTFTGRPRREDGSVIYKETHPEEWAKAMEGKPRKEKTSLAAAEEKINQRPVGVAFTKKENMFNQKGRMNIHPTVKPTDLMTYLVRLVTPKGGVVLDPFMGSGSTGKACVREGMDFIGIEREKEYMEIAKTRIEHEKGKHNYRQFFDI